MKTVVLGVLVLVGVFASVAEAAFIRAVELRGDEFSFPETPPTYRLELVMEEDARLLDAGVALGGPIPNVMLINNPFSFSFVDVFEDPPPAFSIGLSNLSANRFEVSRGDIIPFAILDYSGIVSDGRVNTIEALPFTHLIRGILPGDTGFMELATPIDNIFPGRQLPEPIPLLLVIFAGVVWALRQQ